MQCTPPWSGPLPQDILHFHTCSIHHKPSETIRYYYYQNPFEPFTNHHNIQISKYILHNPAQGAKKFSAQLSTLHCPLSLVLLVRPGLLAFAPGMKWHDWCLSKIVKNNQKHSKHGNSMQFQGLWEKSKCKF